MRGRVTLQLPTQALPDPQPLNGKHILLLGHGYVAQHLQKRLSGNGMMISWTQRSVPTNTQTDNGAIRFGSDAMLAMAQEADFILSSIPPDKGGNDPALRALGPLRLQAEWIGYLSATSVYGDRKGQWAFEGETPTPGLVRGRRRADAELSWLETLPQTQIFRLAGIYGPGRDPFDKLKNRAARVIEKPGHVVNRIHVDDIVSALILSMQCPSPQDIYNIADGHPAFPGDVLDYAAKLSHDPLPERVSLEDPRVSSMARSFYAETKRVDIGRAKSRLNWSPEFPDFKSGLQSIWQMRQDGGQHSS